MDRRNKGAWARSGCGRWWDTGGCQEQLYLNGGPGESGQLFNVCPFLPGSGFGLGGYEED